MPDYSQYQHIQPGWLAASRPNATNNRQNHYQPAILVFVNIPHSPQPLLEFDILVFYPFKFSTRLLPQVGTTYAYSPSDQARDPAKGAYWLFLSHKETLCLKRLRFRNPRNLVGSSLLEKVEWWLE
jgi:hypothetical protein